jgi:hypothetical protein
MLSTLIFYERGYPVVTKQESQSAKTLLKRAKQRGLFNQQVH